MESVLGILFAAVGGYGFWNPDSMRRAEIVPVSRAVYRFVALIFMVGGLALAIFGVKQ